MRVFAWSLLILSGIVGVAMADHCYRPVRVQKPQQQKQQQKQKVVKEVIVEKIVVPNFFAGYHNFYANPYIQPLDIHHGYSSGREEILQLRLEIERLKNQQFQQQSMLLPQPANNVHPGLFVLQGRCARCHTDANKQKGNGFVLLRNGGTSHLSGSEVFQAMEQILSGKMPPGAPLSQDEKRSIVDVLTQ